VSVDDETPPAKPPRAKGLGPMAIAFILLLVGGVLTPVAWVAAHRILPIPGTMLMVERAFAGERLSAHWVGLDAIDTALVRSAIGAEDSRFCSHNGFDFEAIERALAANVKTTNQKRGRLRGGSTISQQTAKNAFAWADRSWVRKGVETAYTVLIEALWPKERIIEAYLNVAEWGDGRFGAEAAARGLFKVSAADLSAADAAALAAVLPSPNRWSAVNPGRRLLPRFAAIRARARAVGAQGLDGCVFRSAQPARADRSAKRAPLGLPPLPTPAPEDLDAAFDPGTEDAPVSSELSGNEPPGALQPEGDGLRATQPSPVEAGGNGAGKEAPTPADPSSSAPAPDAPNSVNPGNDAAPPPPSGR
jgi:monofunctional biosynthetic peptidoglycan transglycosylase